MKNLCIGTQCGFFKFLLILDLWGISFHAEIVFGLGKNLLFKSVLGHCVNALNLHGRASIFGTISANFESLVWVRTFHSNLF